MNEFEALRVKNLIESINKVLLYTTNDEDINLFNNRINYYSKILNDYQCKKLTVYDITKKESGNIKLALKQRIVNTLYKPYSNKHFIENHETKRLLKTSMLDRVNKACEKTVLTDDIINCKVLLSRRYQNSYCRDRLGIEMNEILMNQMLDCFIEQNKELVYELSK